MSRIVVGVDGSEGAQQALEFALREAKLRRAGLRVVMSWQEPATLYAGGFVVPKPVDEEFERGVHDALDRVLAAANGAKEGVYVDAVVRKGQAAKVLVDESRFADLLVVGSRGLGGFRGLLVGSVSQACAHHAHCPVAIVPKP